MKLIMGNDKGNENENSSQQNNKNSTEDTQKIKELEAKLAAKNQEVQSIKDKTIADIKKIKEDAKSEAEIQTNLPARIIKQDTFGNNFHNGYADGKVKKATDELRKTLRKASVAK